MAWLTSRGDANPYIDTLLRVKIRVKEAVLILDKHASWLPWQINRML
ncbi:MAG: hypothetical protein ACTXOO_05965 [Sodalis sp. (in: enterobacteria)]